MSPQHPTPGAEPTPQSTPAAELLDDDGAVLTLDALARACRMDADWVVARLREGLLPIGTEGTDGPEAADDPAAWRFSGATVVRARRLPIWRSPSTPTPSSPRSPPT